MKVQDLIDELQQFDPAAEVAGTWEGQIKPIEVYQAADGVVLIDSDYGCYRVGFQELPCDVCGKPACSAPWGGPPVCFEHSDAFRPPCIACGKPAGTIKDNTPFCWAHYHEGVCKLEARWP